jgi:hypothetical protein
MVKMGITYLVRVSFRTKINKKNQIGDQSIWFCFS